MIEEREITIQAEMKIRDGNLWEMRSQALALFIARTGKLTPDEARVVQPSTRAVEQLRFRAREGHFQPGDLIVEPLPDGRRLILACARSKPFGPLREDWLKACLRRIRQSLGTGDLPSLAIGIDEYDCPGGSLHIAQYLAGLTVPITVTIRRSRP